MAHMEKLTSFTTDLILRMPLKMPGYILPEKNTHRNVWILILTYLHVPRKCDRLQCYTLRSVRCNAENCLQRYEKRFVRMIRLVRTTAEQQGRFKTDLTIKDHYVLIRLSNKCIMVVICGHILSSLKLWSIW